MRSSAGGMRPFARERQVVRVEDAGGIGLAREQRAHGVALAADVIAVLADERCRTRGPRSPDRGTSP